MNRQDIIAMVAEAGCSSGAHALRLQLSQVAWIPKFAALVVAHDRQRLSAGVELPEPVSKCDVETEFFVVHPGDTTELIDAYSADQLRDYGDRRAAAELELIAKAFDAQADKQEAAWNEFLLSGKPGPATSYHSVTRGLAAKIRARSTP